jgi:hypothetical protein
MILRLVLLSLLMVLNAQWTRAEVRSPLETRNAALRYWMAFAEMKDPPADKSLQDLLERTSVGQAAWDEAKLGPILDSNGEALQTMQRATKLPECDWGLEYSRGPRAPIAYLARARVMARLNALQAMREMSAGDSQATVERLLAGIRFSEHLANGGSLMSVLTAKNALLSSLRMLTLEATKVRLTDTQKKQVFAALRALPEDGFDWATAWEMEELSLGTFFAELRSSKVPQATYEAATGEVMPQGATIPDSKDLTRFREYMAAVKTQLKLPPDATKARLEILGTQKRTLNELTQRATPSPQRVNESRAEVLAARKALLVVLGAK